LKLGWKRSRHLAGEPGSPIPVPGTFQILAACRSIPGVLAVVAPLTKANRYLHQDFAPLFVSQKVG
jgi:hypothetical protein